MTEPTSRQDSAHFAPVDPFKAGLACRCPRCGEGKLYAGMLKIAPRCVNCGLDNSFADSGDGPAVFVIMLGGFLILGAALWMEMNLHPPLWLHVLIWIPATFGLTIWLLRVTKAILFALQFKNDAKPGEIDRE